MGMRFTSSFDANRFQRKINSAIQEALEEAVEETVRVIQFFIATRGTAKSGKQGRVETGKMLDSVKGETKSLGGDVFWAGIGWEDFQLYFKYQEEGFVHLGGSQVTAMAAFIDAHPMFRQDIINRLSEKLASL